MSLIELEIPYVPPFDLRFQLEGRDFAERSFWLGELPLVVHLRQAGADGPLHARVFSDQPLTHVHDRVAAAVRDLAAADDDLREFRSVIAHDEKMLRLVDALHGLKPLRVPDVWSTLLRSLTAQQISVAAARAIRERLATRFGHAIQVDEGTASLLPSPATLLQLSDADFTEVGFSRRKVEYARGIAEAVIAGRLDIDALRAAPSEELIRTLSALRGVGVWTAECTGIFCTGHRDLLPADDLGIQQAIGQLYGKRKVPKPKEVTRYGTRWEGWRTYAAVYLWAGRNRGLLADTKPARAQPAIKPAEPTPSARNKAARLPPVRTGARHHTPVSPGRRGR